jgi:RHH-type proline utilization regulon transcriptional repressor/proline dehydrogenase/delta 1-pyrroline-5-carboxylate dehydrogenase
VRNPANTEELLGHVNLATPADIDQAFTSAGRAQPAWDASGAQARAQILIAAAEAMRAHRDSLLRLLVKEAGKTLADSVAEVREAEDFLRYYAAQAIAKFSTPVALPGPTGEDNLLSLHGRGVFACISPWNFPLAIFIGQVAAALAAGNAVIAKPAEATGLIAAFAVDLLHRAGVPKDVLRYVPARGSEFGTVAFKHPALAGVCFTGSTATAQHINRALASRDGAILPLIAETGGINAMLVDASALPEQVADDVITSAFASAGQRCSALRMLFVQADVADRIVGLIAGAMDELLVGDPADLETDVGPVIDAASRTKLEKYCEQRLRDGAKLIKQCDLSRVSAPGHYLAPRLIELSDARQLKSEEFGPILHVVRYQRSQLDDVLQIIRETGYGLTLGVHTRIESTWRHIAAHASVGNIYVNRNMIGAVVGVQPFGGEGLSGTGPKAGGPHYLLRFATERTLTVNTVATGGNARLLAMGL